MQTLESLNKKIKTAQDLLSVVKTMKSLAAVNIRQFERAVESLEEYAAIVDAGWQVFFRYSTPLQRRVRTKDGVCVVIGSDQGMCGQFNELLIARALKEVEKIKAQGLTATFWSVGEKIRGAMTDMGYEGGEHFRVAGSLTAINTQVQALVQQIDSWRSSRGLERFYVCHNLLTKGGGYTPVFYRLLPLDKEWGKKYTGRKWEGSCLPLMGLPREEMFIHLFRQYLFVTFYRALAQSLASENAARLISMQAAEKNILELGEELQGLFREQRQANITNELLDIISGFEALSEEIIAV